MYKLNVYNDVTRATHTICWDTCGNTEENDGTRSQNFTAIHLDLSPFAVEFVNVCRYKIFWTKSRDYSIYYSLFWIRILLRQQYAQRYHQ